MKIYVSIQGEISSDFLELDVSESITAKEVQIGRASCRERV